MKKNTIYTILIVLLIVLSLYFIFTKKTSNGIPTNSTTTTESLNTNSDTKGSKEAAPDKKNVGMANPASVNCDDKGGKLKMETDPLGGQFGLCYFDDNRACEEWAMLRGECPVGGVKTTGYDTIDQKYCVWRGGVTKAEASSTCLFKNGKKCLTIDFYNGTCSQND